VVVHVAGPPWQPVQPNVVFHAIAACVPAVAEVPLLWQYVLEHCVPDHVAPAPEAQPLNATFFAWLGCEFLARVVICSAVLLAATALWQELHVMLVFALYVFTCFVCAVVHTGAASPCLLWQIPQVPPPVATVAQLKACIAVPAVAPSLVWQLLPQVPVTEYLKPLASVVHEPPAVYQVIFAPLSCASAMLFHGPVVCVAVG
jgi:hypothetical protein